MICMLTACGANPDQFLDNGAEDAYELSVTEQTSKEQASADSVNEAEPVSESLYVYVCGAVATPGVYEVSVDSRIYEAVEQAGGMLDTAKTEAVNLAEPLTDGQMIRILSGRGDCHTGRRCHTKQWYPIRRESEY